MTVIVLLGTPGAGKGTQAPVLAEHLGVPVLASGDLLRAAVAARTALGRDAERYMNRGQLVPDSTIVGVFLDRLDQPDARRGAILDGFPRTRVQAQALDDELAAAGRRVDKAIYIDLPPEDVVARMANRRICTENGHVYNLLSNPPQVRASATSTARPWSSGPTTRRRRSATASRSSCRRSTTSSTTTARPASWPRSTAASRSRTSAAMSSARRTATPR